MSIVELGSKAKEDGKRILEMEQDRMEGIR